MVHYDAGIDTAEEAAPRPRVLVVDDDPIVRRTLSAFVEAAGDFVLAGTASNGAEAVDRALRGDLDVVLMDVQMPVKDGISATTEILAKEPQIRVLILTAFDSDRFMLAALRAGAAGFLLKATTPVGLAEAIRSAMAGVTVLSNDPAKALVEQPSVSGSGAPPGLELTTREQAILELLCSGSSNAEIAAELHLAESTVKTHVSTVMTKLGVPSRLKAVVRAHQWGLLREHQR